MLLFGFGIGARLRYASGLPRTEVTGAYFDARDDRFDPLFGPHNAIRLPDFFQIDAQIDRSFVLSARLRLSVLLDVQNPTNYQKMQKSWRIAMTIVIEPIFAACRSSPTWVYN